MGGRGSCRRNRHLRCVTCYKKNEDLQRRKLPYNGWEDVALLGEKGSAYLCKCNQCGHEYTTNSQAAHRAFRSLQNKGKTE